MVTPSRSAAGPGAALWLSLVAGAFVLAAARGTGRHPWLGLVALLPLFRVVQTIRPAWAFAAGGVWGAAVCACSLGFTGSGIAATWQSLVLLALIPAVYAACAAWFTRRLGYSPLVLAVGWVFVEFCLRPLALRHGLLAGTQGDGLVVHTIGRYFGYVLVAFTVAFAAAWLVAILSLLRVVLSRPSCQLLLDDAGRRLWQLIRSGMPRRLPLLARPRAPPAL